MTTTQTVRVVRPLCPSISIKIILYNHCIKEEVQARGSTEPAQHSDQVGDSITSGRSQEVCVDSAEPVSILNW